MKYIATLKLQSSGMWRSAVYGLRWYLRTKSSAGIY